jgi:hypothetical protein
VPIGREVVFETHSSIPGRLIILDVNANRQVVLIFPNKFLRATDLGLIAAQERVTVPGEGYGFSAFRAVKPAGQGRLLALVAPPQFDTRRFAASKDTLTRGFEPVDGSTGYLMELIRQIETHLALEGRHGVARDRALAEWAYTIVDYEITD